MYGLTGILFGYLACKKPWFGNPKGSFWETQPQPNLKYGNSGIPRLVKQKLKVITGVLNLLQPTDMVHLCVFDVNDGSRWKAMSDDAVRSVCDAGVNPDWPSFPPLCASPLDAALVSNELEHELRSLIAQHRRVCTYIHFSPHVHSGSVTIFQVLD